MSQDNTNWGQSVAGVVLYQGKVLLARHTYGSGKGYYIVPGGYLSYGESPQDAVIREYLEETGVKVNPKEIIAIRFNHHDWYVVFRAEYLSGEPRSDHMENDDVVWMDVNEALTRADVAGLSKDLIRCAIHPKNGLAPLPYEGNPKHGKGYLYGK